jgi:hypothetical protein
MKSEPNNQNNQPSAITATHVEKAPIETSHDYQIKWYEVGDDNPYNTDILDIRGLTLNMVATTNNQAVAEQFFANRSSDGKQFEFVQIENSTKYKSNLVYPYNDLDLRGAVFKADAMEVKWDIYAYYGWLYFVKSWTSELIYKVHFIKGLDSFILDEIITASVDKIASTTEEKATLAAQNVHSIMQTHIMDRVWPYKIPEMMRNMPEKNIALHMFAQFGNKATIATFSNVLDLEFSESKIS